MDILIRKIQRKGKALVFKPNSRSGYKFTSESAQPSLTAFQKSCIKIRPQKDRKLGSFWTPNFCYFGSLMVKNGEVSLQDMIAESDLVSMTDFNNYFPSKKYYWYDKAKPQNPAMETYFIGVRAAASVLAHYYNLQKLGQIKEAAILYKKYLMPLGLAKLLSDVDSNLLSDDDYIYPISLSARNCVMKANRTSTLVAKESGSHGISNTKTTTIDSEDNRVSYNKSITNKKEWVGDKGEDEGLRGITPPKARVQNYSDIVASTKIDNHNVSEKPSKKNPNILPNIGEK